MQVAKVLLNVGGCVGQGVAGRCVTHPLALGGVVVEERAVNRDEFIKIYLQGQGETLANFLRRPKRGSKSIKEFPQPKTGSKSFQPCLPKKESGGICIQIVVREKSFNTASDTQSP